MFRSHHELIWRTLRRLGLSPIPFVLVAALELGVLQMGVRLRTLLLLDYGHFFVAGMMFSSVPATR